MSAPTTTTVADSMLPPGRVSAAAVVALPWALVLLAMAVLSPPTQAHWQASDPILHFLPQALMVWGVPVFGLLVAVGWLSRVRPTAAQWRWSVLRALAGLVMAGLIVGSVRYFSGPLPPPFVPTEESAAPGFLLGLSAGYGEELLFRLMLVPPLYWLLERKALEKGLPRPASILGTAVLTGLVFSMLHALGPGDPPAIWHISRFLLPGFLMTFAFLRLGPSFLVTAHCVAHIYLPLAFPS